MRRNSKVLVGFIALCFPVLVIFQNCGKMQGVAVTDMGGSYKTDTLDLPSGVTQIDQTESSNTESEAHSDGGTISINDTVVDPNLENEQDIEEAKAACAELELNKYAESENKHGVGIMSASGKSIYGLRGKHVLSSADFGGSTQIESIENSYGKLILCGLDVKHVTNCGGKLLLIGNSKVENIESYHGEVFVIDGARALLKNSKATIYKK